MTKVGAESKPRVGDRLGIVAGLFLFVLLHSLIAHAADYFSGYDPAEEFRKQGARPEKGGTDGDANA